VLILPLPNVTLADFEVLQKEYKSLLKLWNEHFIALLVLMCILFMTMVLLCLLGGSRRARCRILNQIRFAPIEEREAVMEELSISLRLYGYITKTAAEVPKHLGGKELAKKYPSNMVERRY
jgi:hypothetical protein